MPQQKRMSSYVVWLLDNEKLLRTVLKKRGLHVGLADYEDYLQIARLAFLEGCAAFEKKGVLLAQTNKQDWQPFLYCVINRRLLSEQKRQLKKQARLQENSREILQQQTKKADWDPSQDLIEAEFWQQLWPVLQAEECTYLIEWGIYHHTVTQIASHHGWSRQKVYRLRKAILVKVAALQKKYSLLPDTLAKRLDNRHVSNPRSLQQ